MKYAIFIKPGPRKEPLVEERDDGPFIVYVHEPVVESKANDALVILLAKYFDVSKTSVSIVHGYSSRYKVVEID